MSAIKTLEIPKWGLSMDEGTILNWLIIEGEAFNQGDEICEIETTKIVNVLEAPFSGTLRKILAAEGQTLAVGSPIAVCAESDVSDAEIETFIQSLHTAPAAVHAAPEAKTETLASSDTETVLQPKQIEPAAATATVIDPQPVRAAVSATPIAQTQHQDYQIPASLADYQPAHGLLVTPHAQRLAEKYNIDLAKIQGLGREARISVADLQRTVVAHGGHWPNAGTRLQAIAKASSKDDSQIAATPWAKRLAASYGINLHDCRVSGSRGRVCVADVEAAYRKWQPQAQSAQQALAPVSANLPHSIKLNGMRRSIANRVQAAKRNAAHFRLTIDLNVGGLNRLRAEINQSIAPQKVSINVMLIKAVAIALQQVPELNLQFDEATQQILQFSDADIAVAVALEDGLMMPIVKAANRKSLLNIAEDMQDLVGRAKTGELKPDEITGGSFSISNLGMLGIKHFDAIINCPQGAILAFGCVEKRAIVEDAEIQIAEQMTATLSCDHRVIDGALGAKFLASFKQVIEQPTLILL